MDIFLNYIIEQYNEFTSSYYGDSQDVIEMYDNFNLLAYWKASLIRNHQCFNVFNVLIEKYLCIECSEIICESAFRYSKLAKGFLRRSLKGSSLSIIMFLHENKGISKDAIINNIRFSIVYLLVSSGTLINYEINICNI